MEFWFKDMLSDDLKKYDKSFFGERLLDRVERFSVKYNQGKNAVENVNKMFARNIRTQMAQNKSSAARLLLRKNIEETKAKMDPSAKAKYIISKIFKKISRVGKEKYNTSIKITTQDNKSYIIFVKGDWIHFSDQFKSKINNSEVFLSRVYSFIKNVALANTEKKVSTSINSSIRKGLLKKSWIKGTLQERGDFSNMLQILNMGRITWDYNIVQGILNIQSKYVSDITEQNFANFKEVIHSLAGHLSIEDFKTEVHLSCKKVNDIKKISFFDMHKQEDVVGRYYSFDERVKSENAIHCLDMAILCLTGEKKQGIYWKKLIDVYDKARAKGETLSIREIEERL
jgi:hypothetical protein